MSSNDLYAIGRWRLAALRSAGGKNGRAPLQNFPEADPMGTVARSPAEKFSCSVSEGQLGSLKKRPSETVEMISRRTVAEFPNLQAGQPRFSWG